MGSPQFAADAAVSAGPAAVGAQAWRHRGVVRVTVVAKATFAFARDAVMPRVEPQPIFRAEVNHGNNPARTTRFASDLAPYLDRAEIFFTGHAHAPEGTPVEAMTVRLGLFDGMEPVLDKTLVVRQKGGFTRLPLVYERAFGGIGWPDNPLGVGALPGTGDPSVIDPRDERALAGFGPIGAAWAARRKRLGSTSRKSLEASFIEIPDDFDWGFFAAAPADQRIPSLRGDEWIVMDGLHPTVPRLRMRLPGARGLARVYGLSRWGVVEGQPLALHADTLRIDGDEQLCTLGFRGAFPVATEEALAELRVVAGVELPGEPITWPAPEALPARARPAPSATATGSMKATEKWSDSISLSLSTGDFESVDGAVLDGTLALMADAPREVLPFRPGPAPEAIARGGAARDPQSVRRGTLVMEAIPDFASALPFRPAQPAASAPVPAPNPVAAEAKKEPAASPWAPAPPPQPKAPAPPPPPQGPPAASPTLKKGLYGRFGGKR